MTTDLELEVRGLRVAYDGLVALRDVSLSARRDGVVGIWGPNMSGKSSLLGAVAGITRVASGSILLHDRGVSTDIARLPSQVRLASHRIFLCPEASGVFPSLSVEENLLLTPGLLRLPHSKTDLEQVYSRFPLLGERRRNQAQYLSGGWRQVLAICRARLVHPRVLLCDEPCLGLSPPMAALVLETIADTTDQEGNAALTIITAQTEVAISGRCSRLFILERGQLSEGARSTGDRGRE